MMTTQTLTTAVMTPPENAVALSSASLTEPPAPKTVARLKPAKAAVSAAVAGGLEAGATKKTVVGGGGVSHALSVQQSNARFAQLVNPSDPPDYTFGGRYDLRYEFGVVKHLVLAEEPNVEDAAYGRYCVYLDKVAELNNTLTAMAARRYANAEVMSVAPQAVGALDRVGGLTSLDEDTGEGDVIELHTQDAVRLFLGFDAGVRLDGSKQYPIPGAVRVGTALRTLCSVAVKYGNPYAEMALMQIEGLFASLAVEVETLQSKHTALIGLRAKRSIKLNVRRSSAPQLVPLGFKSPYGFACADLVSQFDYFARVVATTGAAGLVTKEEARLDLLDIKTKFRAVFNEIMRMGVQLGKDQLSQVSRGDWVMYHLTRQNKTAVVPAKAEANTSSMSGGELAKQERDEAARLARMEGVTRCEQLFGMLPSALLLGDEQPKFVTSKVRVTAEERVLIEQIVRQRSEIAVV
jgi:Transcriptional regulator AcaB